MKLTTFLLLVSFTGFAASGYSQPEKVTIQLKDARMKDLFNKVEQQTSYKFLYRDDAVENILVNLDEVDKPLDNILNQILDGSGFTYKILANDLIVIAPRELLQQKQITGIVTDKDGTPLPGVNVVVTGTTQGTLTDIDGKYSIEVPQEARSLTFTFVGMEKQEITIGTLTQINVTMAESAIGLEEIVVIGYGTAKRSDLTGAVSSVQGDAITNRKTTQISTALQGTIPGVMVTRNNSAPGATATIRIRGITTIGENDPLVIVDGVPVGSINDINPNDVESISVLKDAASASIYGSRAAAGVILVTTIRAKSGELSLSYNAEYGIEKPSRLPEVTNALRYLQMINEQKWNDNINIGSEYPVYTQDFTDNYMTRNLTDPDHYPITDWQALMIKNQAPRQSHVLGISVGSKVIRSKMSIAYDKTDALYNKRTYERITARFNNDVNINKFISSSLDFSFKRTITSQPTVDPMNRIRMSAPIFAAQWSDGRVAEGKAGANVYGQVEYGGFNDNWYNIIAGKMSLDITPFDGLKLSAILAPSFSFDKGKNFRLAVPYTGPDDPEIITGYLEGGFTSTMLSESRNDDYQITSQLLANYMKSFGNHDLNIMGGYENYYAHYENLGASRDQFLLTSYPYLNLGPLDLRDNSGSAWENAYRSFFGRIMYSYKSKYLLQANVRYDGSSRFQKDYRWGTFPSFSAGWIVTEENFMQNIPVLSFLKLRASWGKLGNERIGNYPYQSTVAFNNALFYEGNQIVAAQTAAQVQYAIADISWESTESTDFGIDLRLLNNKLSLAGDYFFKQSKDMLLALEIPDYMGYENPDQNTGKMKTTGWELEIGWKDNAGDLSYSASFNISDFKSVMGDLGGTQFLGDQIKKEGSEFNEWYGYRSDGIYQTQEEVDNSAKTSNQIKPGDIKYVDISGPAGVPDGIISAEYDRTLLGGSLPRYMFGANLRLDYKNFDFSLVIQGVGKQNSIYADHMIAPFAENWGNVPKIIDGNYWSIYNSDAQNLNALYPRLSQVNAGNNYIMSDYWMFKGSYLRLKNITLGYTLPQNLSGRIGMQNVRVYSSISDLFTLDHFPQGWDPESTGSSYPITTSFVFGISVKF